MTFIIDSKKNTLVRVATLIGMVLLALTLTVGGPAVGAEKRKKKTSKKNFIPSETTGRKLLKVSELAEEDRFQEALDVLEPLTKRKKLKKYDKAKVYETRGYMFAALERYPESRQSFELALAQNYLPDPNTESLKYGLAQLYLADPTPENLDRSIALLNEWFENANNPGYQPHFLLAAAYAQQDAWDKALPHARQAVKKAEAQGKVTEQFYGLLLAMEFQNGNLLESLEVLKLLASKYPKKQYYMQLAYAYSNMGDEDKALATLQIAHEMGFFDREREFTQLAQRLLFSELPWQAAKVMMDGFEKELLEENEDNYELLANSLLHAREYDKAIGPLSKAATMAEDGDLYIRLAQVHLEIENWRDARAALESAIEKGGLRQEGSAHLLLGISNFNEKRFKSARSAFNVALKDENTAESARKWLEHVDRATANEAATTSES
jgi:tetratricopeptide (TPR) repeat protein